MCHLKWPVVLFLFLETLSNFHEVSSTDQIIALKDGSSEGNRYSVPQAQPIIRVHNVTLLDSSQISSPSESIIPPSPDILEYSIRQTDGSVDFSSLLEPNTHGGNFSVSMKHNVTAVLPNQSEEKVNYRTKVISLVEPNIQEETQATSRAKVGEGIKDSPVHRYSFTNTDDAEPTTETPLSTTYGPQVTEEEKFTTVFDSENTFPSTSLPENGEDIQFNNYVQYRQSEKENIPAESDIIQHVPISEGRSTSRVSKEEIPRTDVPVPTGREQSFRNIATVPVHNRTPEPRETNIGSIAYSENMTDTSNDSNPIVNIDILHEPKPGDIKRVTVSESLINSQNPDQEIKKSTVIKPNLPGSHQNDGILVTSVPGYHPNDVLHVTTSEMYPAGGNFNTSAKERHPCARPCVTGAPTMVCRFDFVLEWYYTMSKACYDCPLNLKDCDRMDCVVADGVKRPIVVVNRKMPGPSVEVCKGDRIIVDMENRMMEESTTIHWHGHHQRGTPYMDGVPYVTQCPIPPKSIFRYHYMADTPGTHFWHSHSGCQRADGAFGALIVRVPPPEDPHSKLYDQDLSEHIVQILDWDHKLGVDKFLAHHHANGDNKPVTLLVNGRGRFHQFKDVNHLLANASVSPTATFIVQKGLRFRFRLINAGFLNCPIELSIDNHTITIISSDGSDITPVEADSLVSYAGERFDFVVNANQKIENYWMRFRGLMDCDERFTSAHQVAVLHYEGAPEYEEPSAEVSYEASRRRGLQVNSLNVGSGTVGSLVMPELNATADDDASLVERPDMTFYLSYDFYEIDNPHYHRAPYYGFPQVPSKLERLLTPQLNHISLKLPPFPLLSQHSDLGSSYQFCNETTVQNCSNQYCECTHVIQVPLGAVLELILVDKGEAFDANHPFHLHGHAFRVVAMQRLGKSTSVDEVQKLDEAGLIHRKLQGAPIKDTVTVPDGGFTIVRVHASNPGYWLFHCHIEFHVELGMAVVFKVGEHEDFPSPPRGFPQCNNFIPPENEEMEKDAGDIRVPIISITHWWPHESSSCAVSLTTVYFSFFITLIMLAAVR